MDVELMFEDERIEYLLNNGWVQHGRLFVKQEWLDESTTLNLPPHYCPNWYHTETLDGAWDIMIKENTRIIKNG